MRTETTASGTADQIVKTTDYNGAGKPKRTATQRTDYPASVTGVAIDASVDITYTPGGRQACTKTRLTAPSPGVTETFSYQATDYTNGQPTTQRTSKSGVTACGDTPTDTTKWLISASSYNPAGQVAWSQNPQQYLERPNPAATDHAKFRTTYSYDVLGRAWKVDTPDPANAGTGTVSTRTCFNRRGETTATIAADNAVTLTTYFDAPGLVRTVVDPTGTVYNAANNGCASTVGSNTKKGATAYTYDGRGNRLTRQVWLDNNTTNAASWVSSTESWGYDAAGRLTGYTNGVDAPVTIAYTQAGGRITNKATTSGSGADLRTSTEWYLPSGAVDHVDETQGATTRTVTDTYDAVGRLKTQTVAGSPASTLTYTYNQAGNIIQVDYPAVGTQTAKTAKTWWNLAGVPTHLTLTNGSYWRLGHDQAGRLTGVDLAYGAWVPVGAYTLDGNGQPLVETLNSGSGGMNRTTTRRLATGQPSQVSQVVDAKTCAWTLTNDSAGRLKTLVQTSATNQTCDQPGQTTTFGYDAASQLTSAANTGTVPDGRPKSWTYSYGNTGNRLTETSVRKGTGGGADTTTTTASRYSGGRLCATGPTLPASCNAATGVTTYGYDTAGRRTSVGRPTGQPSTTYTYDPGGRLASTSFAPISGGTDVVTRGYDPAGSMNLDVHTTPDNTTAELVSYWDHTGATPVPQVMTTTINGASYQLSYGYERITSTGNWYATDPLGSVLPTSTNSLSPSEYDPYGTPVNWPVDFGWNYFGYRGEWANGDHLHLRNRDYDYRTGTFLTHDPLDGEDGTAVVANPYHYANNNPINKVDPAGLRPWDEDFKDPCWGDWGARPVHELVEFGWLSDINYDLGYSPNDCVSLPDKRDGHEEAWACATGFWHLPNCVGAVNAVLEAKSTEDIYRRNFAGQQYFGSRADAVKHTALAAFLVIHVGQSDAAWWLHFHEYHRPSGGPKLDQQDRANNHYGLLIGKQFGRWFDDGSLAALQRYQQIAGEVRRIVLDFVSRDPSGACLVKDGGDSFVSDSRCGQNLSGYI